MEITFIPFFTQGKLGKLYNTGVLRGNALFE